MSNNESNPQWVVVAKTVYPHEAHVIAGMLRDNGIDANVGDEYVNQVYGFASHAFGGVKVRVRKEDEEKALQIIGEDYVEPPTNGTTD